MTTTEHDKQVDGSPYGKSYILFKLFGVGVMETQKFCSPLKDRVFHGFLYLIIACLSLAPFLLVWIRNGLIPFEEAARRVSATPSLLILFGGGSLLLLFIKTGGSVLRFPVTINQVEITQAPWLGKARRIRWEGVDRIQVLDGTGYRGMRAYRIRIFSKTCVIAFTNDFAESNVLIDLIQGQAEKHNIPIYQEDTVGVTRVVFGSWDIDSSGKSAGVSLTRISSIPSP